MVFNFIKTSLFIILCFFACCVLAGEIDVKVSPNRFSPGKGEMPNIHYKIEKEMPIKIIISHESGLKVRDICFEGVLQSPGDYTIVWDGKNDNGLSVPSGVYFLEVYEIIDKGKGRLLYSVFDEPVSGVEAKNIKIANNSIAYSVDKDAKVRIRTGFNNCPVFKTLCDWEPMVEGENKQRWDGYDTSNTYNILEDKRKTISINAIGLPENYIYVQDSTISHDEYLKKIAEHKYKQFSYYKSRKVLPSPVDAYTIAQDDASNHIGQAPSMFEVDRMHLKHNPLYCKEPKITVNIINSTGMVKDGYYYKVDNGTEFVINLAEGYEWFQRETYKIEIYLDANFIRGEFKGYTPYRFKLDLTGVNKGKHLVTINLRGFQDHIAVFSVPVLL